MQGYVRQLPVFDPLRRALDKHQVDAGFRNVERDFVNAVADGCGYLALLPTARRKKRKHAHVLQTLFGCLVSVSVSRKRNL